MNTQKQITLMVLLVFLLLGGCAAYTVYDQPREDKSTDSQQGILAERGARIFARYCRQCHGDAGQGRIGPQLNRDDLRDPAKRTETQLWVGDTIACGRIGKVMPPWAIREGGALTDEQIRDLVALITGAPPGSTSPSINAWDKAQQFSSVENALAPVPSVEDVLKGAAITGGGATRVCGQFAATPGAAESTAVPADLKPQDAWTVVTTDNKFSITNIGINAGTAATVTQQNQGQALHNWEVLSPDGITVLKDDSGKPIATQVQDPGKQASVTFTLSKPGVYTFRCQVHPQDMLGRLYVIGSDGTAGGGASATPAAGSATPTSTPASR